MTDDGSPPLAKQGHRLDGADPAALKQAMSSVVGYRGDVTVTRKSTGDSIDGYVFDCRPARAPVGAVLRLLPANGGGPVAIDLADVAAIEFTGRDTAAGKSFETWIRKYVEEKLAGRPANIECDRPEASSMPETPLSDR
jgi:hypothetical protein